VAGLFLRQDFRGRSTVRLGAAGRAFKRRRRGLPIADSGSDQRVCPVCGGPLPASLGPLAIYCSIECRHVSDRQRRRVPPADSPTMRTCLVCGKLFPQTPHYHQEMKYCSRKCAGRANYRRRRGLQIATEVRTCANCGKPVDHQKRIDAIYCSNRCAVKAGARRRHREKNKQT
jgi:predicted nucleic acid-binding Zn ribbon protein